MAPCDTPPVLATTAAENERTGPAQNVSGPGLPRSARGSPRFGSIARFRVTRHIH